MYGGIGLTPAEQLVLSLLEVSVDVVRKKLLCVMPAKSGGGGGSRLRCSAKQLSWVQWSVLLSVAGAYRTTSASSSVYSSLPAPKFLSTRGASDGQDHLRSSFGDRRLDARCLPAYFQIHAVSLGPFFQTSASPLPLNHFFVSGSRTRSGDFQDFDFLNIHSLIHYHISNTHSLIHYLALGNDFGLRSFRILPRSDLVPPRVMPCTIVRAWPACWTNRVLLPPKLGRGFPPCESCALRERCCVFQFPSTTLRISSRCGWSEQESERRPQHGLPMLLTTSSGVRSALLHSSSRCVKLDASLFLSSKPTFD